MFERSITRSHCDTAIAETILSDACPFFLARPVGAAGTLPTAFHGWRQAMRRSRLDNNQER